MSNRKTSMPTVNPHDPSGEGKMWPQYWLHVNAGDEEYDANDLVENGACPSDRGDISVCLIDHNRSFYSDAGYHTEANLGWVNWSEITLSPEQDAVIFGLAVDNNATHEPDFMFKITRGEDGQVHLTVDTFDATMQINKRPL